MSDANSVARLERSDPARPVGIIYVAIGARFVREAALSAKSVQRFVPDVPIVLYTDQVPAAPGAFDEIVHLPSPHPMAYINKLIAMAQSPFEKTLLLDTDTYVCADISALFAVLDRFDIAMSQDRGYIDEFPAGSNVPDAFVEFNQGVIAFRRCDALAEALQESLRWTDKLAAKLDQPPFRIALFHSRVRIATLPYEYNCRFASYGMLNGTVRILHGRLPNGEMSAERYERVARILNRVAFPRVHIVDGVFAMLMTRRFGVTHRTRPMIGRLFRPSVVLWRSVGAAARRRLRAATRKSAAGWRWAWRR